MFTKQVSYGLYSLCGALLLCTPFGIDPGLVNGIVMGKLFWAQLMVGIFSVVTLFLLLMEREKASFTFTGSDLLILAVGGWWTATYSRTLDPEPERLLFAGQLIVLWFLVRNVLGKYLALSGYYLLVLMGIGLIEAIWGVRQLHGWSYSNHSLFRLTGSFFNPGPYSGFLAVVLPVCMGVLLKQRSRNIPYYFAAACILSILVVLPAGMSRSAWIAATLSCAWTYAMYRMNREWIGERWRQHKIRYTIGGIVLCILLAGGMPYLYSFKKDSADGRFVMWKITAQAIRKQPVSGVGLGGFPAAYAKTQADYMASGVAGEQEKRVAGCPEYAFNEYLQIGLEQGLCGLLLFAGWMAYTFYRGMRQKEYACCGGLLSLALFAFSSYPLQLPEYWVVLIFLGAMCVTPASTGKTRIKGDSNRHLWYKTLFIGIVAFSGIGLFGLQRKYYNAYKEWSRIQLFYKNKAYEAAVGKYEKLYPLLNHKPEYLFEAAQCLGKTGHYEKANEYLRRAVRLSADPMLYYVMAQNEQATGQYKEAEDHLLYAIDILPGRIYPYYLLAKLYFEPSYYQPLKLKSAIDSVLLKDPKVESMAIREMRENARNMLKNTE